MIFLLNTLKWWKHTASMVRLGNCAGIGVKVSVFSVSMGTLDILLGGVCAACQEFCKTLPLC